ncbi:hypothetical protein F444_17928 [Phytophthora nicotianae P1976]|uniref:Uncharacterized protein n=1 Tax=Phytophthora nicotianae P1976 TaxID=1317066 RepID=A0A080ZDD4_PHYNI|nr:hypothetical protein F444_17928 [Phytophthora nicotianae P1976]
MVAVARDCNSLLHNSNTTSAATTIVLAIGKEVTVTTGLAGIPQETFAALWANHGNSTLKDISAIRERREALRTLGMLLLRGQQHVTSRIRSRLLTPMQQLALFNSSSETCRC